MPPSPYGFEKKNDGTSPPYRPPLAAVNPASRRTTSGRLDRPGNCCDVAPQPESGIQAL